MRGRRLRGFLAALAFGLGPPLAAVAQVEGTVETGLAQLAQQIVSKSAAAGKTTIAVLPFLNADGSCSVLSTFIADELIQNLFSVPNSKLEIVERSQRCVASPHTSSSARPGPKNRNGSGSTRHTTLRD